MRTRPGAARRAWSPVRAFTGCNHIRSHDHIWLVYRGSLQRVVGSAIAFGAASRYPSTALVKLSRKYSINPEDEVSEVLRRNLFRMRHRGAQEEV